jgi:hypothetical protein
MELDGAFIKMNLTKEDIKVEAKGTIVHIACLMTALFDSSPESMAAAKMAIEFIEEKQK